MSTTGSSVALVALVCAFFAGFAPPQTFVSAQQQDDGSGNWLLRSFVEHMHCEMKEEQDVEFWRDVHRLTSALDPLSEEFSPNEYEQVRVAANLPDLAQPQPEQVLLQRISHVQNLLTHILVPYNVVDPVFALECPLGTAALLKQFARYCLHLFQERCAQRAVRVLQLAKLMTLFNFPDYGTMMGQSKWRADLGTLSSQVYELYGPGAQTAVRRKQLTAPVTAMLSIGIVSYCNYGSSSFPLPGWSRRNKNAYAKKHGYVIHHLEKPIVKQYHPWMNKLLAVRHYLPSHDWIMWVDCDAYFMNFEEKIEDLLFQERESVNALGDADQAAQTATILASGEQEDGQGGSESGGGSGSSSPASSDPVTGETKFDFVIAEDGNMFNSGVFLIKNSAWGMKFLNNSIDLLAAPMPYSFQHNQWHEQSPFMYIALVPHILDLNTLISTSSLAKPEKGLVQTDWRTLGYDPSHVRVVPQSRMNSYPPELVQRTQHALRHHGFADRDFVISFNGCGSVLGGDVCLKIFGDYFEQSMRGVQE
ncbi:unnamed protein product [Amoebophrya sp. A120]|nr:unnamed protein product [Amoebophrya sp. A120]|eukprot:GSA120T00011442001.1